MRLASKYWQNQTKSLQQISRSLIFKPASMMALDAINKSQAMAALKRWDFAG
tara:strand:+ start:279 stop:434 length:156 start_codon:yes stop_codon:yes gene_type:complete